MTPVLSFPAELLLQAQGPNLGMKAAIFDVDGVLTDGRLYIGEGGEQFKPFSTLDGHGLKLLARAGITPLVITGRDSPAVRRRVADLGLKHAVYGAHDKLAAAEQLLAQLGLAWSLQRLERCDEARPHFAAVLAMLSDRIDGEFVAAAPRCRAVAWWL